MSAYVVVHATIKDQAKMREYGSVAGATVAQHGGEVVCRAPSEVLCGENPHTLTVLLKFPNKQAARDWYNCDAYQAVIPTRNAAMDATFTLTGDD